MSFVSEYCFVFLFFIAVLFKLKAARVLIATICELKLTSFRWEETSVRKRMGKHPVTSCNRETQKSRLPWNEGTTIKSIHILSVDRHLAHSWQNRAGGDGGGTDKRPSEVQHRDEELDDMDARDDGNDVDQSDGDVLPQVQPEGGHHPDSLGALASQGRQKRSDLVLAGRRAPGQSKLSVRNRQRGRHGGFLGS